VAKRSRAAEDENRRLWRNRFRNGHVPLPQSSDITTLPLIIHQCDGPAESAVFRLDSIRVGCCISIRCLTDVRGGVPLDWVDVETPWNNDVVFDPLPDPATLADADQYYRFHGPGRREYERRFVINHRFPGILQRGPGWEGFLLGIFYGTIPNKIPRPLNLRVVLHDAFNRSAVGIFELMVEPDPKPRVHKDTRRKSIFDSENVSWRKFDQGPNEYESSINRSIKEKELSSAMRLRSSSLDASGEKRR